ncbi:NADH:flavin oxidoreductase [Paraburkholderia adhaesiva]|uniref:NADH:flavin oxidoreductase n=1 Tax=Paraburkholderia adhaesiva TaxID=2883244 RepID=UPI001F44BD7B|nr:NADH:flavin oxidoreductase [Paraburkholderia adhaesiva]
MTEISLDALFEPFELKTLKLKNRVVMSPMTRSFSPEGVPGADVAAYYQRRADNGVGLIISEGTVIDRPASRNDPNIPLFHGDAPLNGWQSVIDGVHAAGGAMGPQIWHVGSVKSPMTSWEPDNGIESPSGLVDASEARGTAMTDEAIVDTIDAFARAAADAQRLGFDVIEIHGAHGYLIDQFFWSATNRRSDRYGGITLRERSRFAIEVIRAMRRAVGAELPIILRLSQWKQQDYAARLADTPDAMADWLVPLVEAGVDILHCSQRRFWEPEFPDVDGLEGLNFAGWAKKLTGAATITVGSVGLSGDFLSAFGGETSQPASLANLVQRLERREFDLVAVGRALLSDPAWAEKLRRSEPLAGFNPSDMAALH